MYYLLKWEDFVGFHRDHELYDFSESDVDTIASTSRFYDLLNNEEGPS